MYEDNETRLILVIFVHNSIPEFDYSTPGFSARLEGTYLYRLLKENIPMSVPPELEE